MVNEQLDNALLWERRFFTIYENISSQIGLMLNIVLKDQLKMKIERESKSDINNCTYIIFDYVSYILQLH